jgi:hypothetical protein
MSVKLDLKNKLINGGFDFWQRNTSFAAIANNTYHTDRFHYIKTGAMIQTIARSTDVPSTSNSIYSLLSTVTTIDATIAAGDYTGILQHIEGNVLRSFKSKKMVMTFWVKAFKTGTYCISIRNGTATRSLVLEYTVNASNTWEKKTVRFTHDASGTWAYDTAIGMTVVFIQASGSTFNTTANTWQNGQYFATANQVNGVDSVSNTFQLSDICLVEDNEGQTRVPNFMYAGRDYFEELQLCQRYYEKSYDLGIIPGTISTDGAFTALASASGAVDDNVTFKIIKRIAPTSSFILYSTATGAANTIRDDSGAVDRAQNVSNIGTTGARALNSVSFNAGGRHSFHWTADAEL